VTNGAKLYSEKLALFHFWAHLTGGIGTGAFKGLAGTLQRPLYVNGEFNIAMVLAATPFRTRRRSPASRRSSSVESS